MDEAAAGARIHAAHPVRRWALRVGAVLGFAAGAWFLGCSTAAAETPDASPPGFAGGLLDSVYDDTLDLAGSASSAILAGADDDASATASSPEAAAAGQVTVAPPVVTLARSAPDGESAAPVGDLVTHRSAPATPSAPADAGNAPPTAIGGDDAAHLTVTVVDAVARNAAAASVARVTGIHAASDSPIGAAMGEVRHVTGSANLWNLPAVSLIAPVTEAIRPVLGAVGAELAPVTEIVMSATDALDGTLTGAGDPAGQLVALLALPDLSSAGGGQGGVVRGASGGADTVEGKSPGDEPWPTRFQAVTTAAHSVVVMRLSADPAPPVAARPAVDRVVVDSLAGPQRDQPARSPAPPVVTVAAGVGSNGGFDGAAWAPAAGTSRHDLAVVVRASEQPAVLEHACDPGFSPD